MTRQVSADTQVNGLYKEQDEKKKEIKLSLQKCAIQRNCQRGKKDSKNEMENFQSFSFPFPFLFSFSFQDKKKEKKYQRRNTSSNFGVPVLDSSSLVWFPTFACGDFDCFSLFDMKKGKGKGKRKEIQMIVGRLDHWIPLSLSIPGLT